MFVRLFKTQNPFNLVILFILAVGIRLPYILDSAPIPVFYYNEAFSTFLFGKFAFLWGNKFFNILFTTVLYYALALWLTKIVNDFSLIFKNTHLPALLFIVITGMFPTFFTFNAAILVIFFQLWIFIRLFKLYKSNQANILTFDLGIIVSIASLFYFPAIAWILLVWIALLLFRPFNWREWASSIMGAITTYLFVAFYYFWFDRWDDFFILWQPLKNYWQINIFPRNSDYLPLIPMVLILVVSFNKLRENFYKNVLQVRKAQQLLIFSIIITACSFYIKPTFSINHFILLAAPIAVFLSYYFLVAKKHWISEGLILLMIISALFFQMY